MASLTKFLHVLPFPGTNHIKHVGQNPKKDGHPGSSSFDAEVFQFRIMGLPRGLSSASGRLTPTSQPTELRVFCPLHGLNFKVKQKSTA